ncbi:MAG TPA: 8-amino-7-oxononanoate synthase [Candidatus Lustribacter sp.]|nr:8-amino-7-oxononanoate synthase [Candidatus Lustribacter sp.]
MNEFLDWLSAAATRREELGLTRRLRAVKPGELLDLAGNDYLGLLRHPAVVSGAVAAAQTYGGGAGASRLVTGTLPIHDELESRLASLTRSPAALVFSTGYHANLAAVTALTDAQTLLVSDAHIHASLVDAARLSRATVAVAGHCDVDAVVRLLRGRDRHTHPRALVMVESIYSVLGDAAPLAALAEVCMALDAVLLVDEAHGIGVAGPAGEGLAAQLGLTAEPGVVTTVTLSKALAAQGGAVLGHPAVRDHLVNTARPFIYDTGLAPGAAGAALGALDVLAAEPHRLGAIRRNAELLADACGVARPDGAVLSVAMAGPAEALAAVADAEARGIRMGCFRPPSTPDKTSRLRLTAHANHEPEDLAPALDLLRGLLRG